MKTIIIIITCLSLSILCGCEGNKSEKTTVKTEEVKQQPVKEAVPQPSKEVKTQPSGSNVFLTVGFQKDKTLRYQFINSRDTEIKWQDGMADKYTDTLEMVVAYKPEKINPVGLSTVTATCESINAKRSSSKGHYGSGKDAIESLTGRSFTIKVGPTGRIEDYSELDKLIKEAGKNSFRKDGVKEPDMISDFVATQWFLWDSVSSIEKPAKGVTAGQTWTSELSIPTPMILREGRDVNYTLGNVIKTEKGSVAVIDSTYKHAQAVPKSWPVPYTGNFQMSGPFGFLGGYKILELKGSGQEKFNIDLERSEGYNQQYTVKMESSPPLNIGVKPQITINQTIKMKLIEE